MGIFLLVISAIGLVLLITSIVKLVSPFTGWSCIYPASTQQMTANIPKPGRYAINIRRDRFWLWQGQGALSDAFPHVNFSVQRAYNQETIQYVPQRNLMTSNNGRRMTVPVGYFDTYAPGDHLITSQPESRFFENEEIVIREHLPFVKFFLLIWGIIIGAMMFLSGLILGILTLAGVFAML